MTSSMTGFGRSDRHLDAGLLVAEVRAVNHRHLELQIRLPEELRALEPVVRARVAACARRGKVDCVLRWESEVAEAHFTLQPGVVQALLAATAMLPPGVQPLRAIDVLRWPGVLAAPAIAKEDLEAAALSVMDAALAVFQQQREREGAHLKAGLQDRVALMRAAVARARALVPELVPEFRRRLVGRLRDLNVEADPARLEQELALLAQRADISEELDRLEVHAEALEQILEEALPAGRRLDFMMQELNREANTLGSKATDLRLTNIAVDLKVVIEQMREQVQNLE